MKNVIPSLLTMITLMTYSRTAGAETDFPALGCRLVHVTPSNLAVDRSSFVYATIPTPPTGNATAWFVCPVTAPMTYGPSHLYLLYQDATGTSATAYVQATYYKVNKTTGDITGIKSVHSDSFSSTGVNYVDVGFTDTYSPSYYYYYIIVKISKNWNAGSANVRFYGTTVW